MSTNLWIGVLLPLAVLAVIAVAAYFAPYGRSFRLEQDQRVVCPSLGKECDCRLEQEVHSGRWARVLACSAYPDRSDLPCDQACARLMNLGVRLAPPAA